MKHDIRTLPFVLGTAMAICLQGIAAAQTTIRLNPQTFGTMRETLASNGDIREVILEAGVYHAGTSLGIPKDMDPAKHPLLIRAADGAEVIFDGHDREASLESKARSMDGRPNVFVLPFKPVGNDTPKLWEPTARIRYRLVADVESVARFPATYSLEDGRLIFHTSDSQPPRPGEVLLNHVYLDYGLFIDRPHVTVRGLKFRNYLARNMWSTGIQLRADHITVEDCEAVNCSLGFTIVGNHNTVRNSRAEDCGGGIYVGGEEATIENCRLFKRRDAFMVPMYAQNDAGIQFYYPAKGGAIRGNLVSGFLTGIFIKASSAAYVIEHNTMDGQGQGTGFGATKWGDGQRFRHNLIVNCARDIDPLPSPPEGVTRDLDFNCYWTPSRADVKPIGPNDVVADPKFIWPAIGDYRLANDSPALKLQGPSGPAGAFSAIGDATMVLGEPRQWHVSESGRDGRDGTIDQPVRTIQFAVDRAQPGDTIVVHPGLYADSVTITRGGTAERPIVIRAAEKWRAILDSNRQVPVVINITNAPHVQIHDLEIRWYGKIAIRIENSPHVTVAGCRIWNDLWLGGGWPTGVAVWGQSSPNITAHANVLFRQEHGVWLHTCARSVLTHNTAAANLYSAASLYHSEACVVRNNSFAFQGNDVLIIQLSKGQADRLKHFDIDYNNYATSVRQVPEGATFDTVTPRTQDRMLDLGSKAIVNYTEYGGEMNRFLTMKQWREFSGLDANSLFADPLYVNVTSRDFRLESGSPNIGAGGGGVAIGFHQPEGKSR